MTTEQQLEPAEALEQTDTTGPNAEAARYRRALRETEAARDALTERLSGYQRREAERLAGSTLSKGADLWLDGATLDDLLDGDGQVDPDKITAAVQAVLDGRPQLRSPSVSSPDAAGIGVTGSLTRDTGPSWQTVLKGGSR
jgi:hypothetical protein